MADTDYYLRAVTQNEQGTYYGGVVTFKTDAAGFAAVTNAEPFCRRYHLYRRECVRND